MFETTRLDNLEGMAVFAHVVEAKSFTHAARRLGRSKSAVSKAVSRLEDRLGARLLNRTTRRLSLTEAGAAFYERARRVLAEAERAELAVSALQDEPRGLLRINAPNTFGQRHLGPAIARFLRQHPGLAIDITLDDRFVDLVDERFDVAVRIAALPDSSLIARRLAPNRRVVCASPAYFARAGMPERPADLRRHNCFGYAYQATGDEWRFIGPEGPTAVRVSGSLSANNGTILKAALLDGIGVGLLPTFSIDDELRDGRLVTALDAYEDSGTSVYAVYPHSRHLSTKVRAFVDFLADYFGPEPYWDRS
jgi:DNA-binding transcriptional LysR family regulator